MHHLVQAIASSSTGEAVYRADSRNVIRSGGSATDYIGTITVSVDDSWSQPRHERRELTIFPQIAPGPHDDRRDRNIKRLQPSYEWMPRGFARLEHCGDVHGLPPLSGRQHRHDALEPSFARRGQDYGAR